MAGVWIFKNNGVMQLVENPGSDYAEGKRGASKQKVLVHLPSGQVVSSYKFLDQILGIWGGRDFNKFSSVYMYDIVVKNPNLFHVKDM
ncbi:hypothetical protein SASPL_147951 [Salvia splendens]|uniref:Uncharacterized protein n=1 Tax=Salvia splendens TaxID=180675 RepID=A0A8X8W9R2_SALSN|nr:hypothetical protein SASPL_147951 [Salvia splendens]